MNFDLFDPASRSRTPVRTQVVDLDDIVAVVAEFGFGAARTTLRMSIDGARDLAAALVSMADEAEHPDDPLPVSHYLQRVMDELR